MSRLTLMFLLSLAAVSLIAAQKMHASELPSDADWGKLPTHPRLFANAARFDSIKNQKDAASSQLVDLLRSFIFGAASD